MGFLSIVTVIQPPVTSLFILSKIMGSCCSVYVPPSERDSVYGNWDIGTEFDVVQTPTHRGESRRISRQTPLYVWTAKVDYLHFMSESDSKVQLSYDFVN